MGDKINLKIITVVTDECNSHVKDLTLQYLMWVGLNFKKEFNVDIKESIHEHVDNDLREISKYFPPNGRLLLCEYEKQVVGMVRMRKIGEKIGEVKNLYVLPEFRGKGLGRRLLEKLIQEARNIRYLKLWLDTGSFMKEAQALYRSVGFKEITSYPGSDILQIDALEFLRSRWIYMDLVL